MIGPLVGGAFAGLGLLLLVIAIRPRRRNLASTLHQLDVARESADPGFALRQTERAPTGFSARLGRQLVQVAAERGWRMINLRQDLAVTGKSLEQHLVTKVLLGGVGFILIPTLAALLLVAGVQLPIQVPVIAALAVGAFFFFLPDLTLRSEAAALRKDFRHAIGSFLDLVSMNLSGGRGVPEALSSAAQIGSGPAIERIRETLAFARLQGLTPWAALGELGHRIGLIELVDLSSALLLVADDGAKVRDSLSARAASMRSRELTESEGEAGERSETMLVAQLLLCTAFLMFLAYPAAARIFSS
ncbi:MAG: type II secretion system F family protein [Pseudonocardiales bacterium]